MFNLLQAIPRNLTNPFKTLTLDDTFSGFNRVYLFALALVCGVAVTLNDYAGERDPDGDKVLKHRSRL